jgi:HAD superfamily hydrolase (TIGR01509 family)
MIQGLIFDFDGLILDTEVPSYQCWQEVYEEHSCVLPLATWATCIGRGHTWTGFDPYDHLEQQIGYPISREEIRAKRRQRFADLIVSQPLSPGVESYLGDARQMGLKLAVASSSPRDWVEGHLTRYDVLASFDCLKCFGDSERAKPAPDLYLAALDALGLQADQAIAFEDSPNGVWAAKRAGIFCVAVPNPITAQLDLDHADLRLTSLAEISLPDLLARIPHR